MEHPDLRSVNEPPDPDEMVFIAGIAEQVRARQEAYDMTRAESIAFQQLLCMEIGMRDLALLRDDINEIACVLSALVARDNEENT